MKLKDYLKQYKLITDGAFGTYYTEKYQTMEMPEAANVSHRERVVEIHRSYIEAGAKLIRTNTFASNTVLLNTGMDEVLKNIRSAAALAKEAAAGSGQEIFIAGDIGPIPAEGTLKEGEIEAQYREIAGAFLGEGLEILTFETFPDMEQILPVIRELKKENEVFIMVQFCINQFGYSNSGLSAKKLLAEAAAVPEIDAVGFNCGVGPGHMEQVISRLDSGHGKYRIALPNAGYPKRSRNQIQFSNNPAYFAAKMAELSKNGIDILGGCCGTNPGYIERLAETVDLTQTAGGGLEVTVQPVKESPVKRGFFYEKDGSFKQKKLIAVELAPPVNANDEKLLEAAHYLQNAGVDVLTFPDSPSGRTRVDSVLMAEKVRKETGLNVMPHICCRDKNAIAMRSLLLGAHINDIHNLLMITGDPVPSMIRQTVKAVFNFDSVGLMKIAQDMNEEVFADCPVVYGGAISQGRRNLEVEIGRVKKKMAAGAEFFLTQPVFCREEADRIRRIREETGARILCGIMPFISRKNALFMKNEIAGIHVPDEIVERYPENGTREEGEAVGVAIAKEVMEYTRDFTDGYYFSFPFNRVYLLKKIME